MKTALQILVLSWLACKALQAVNALRRGMRRDRLSADFARELRRRGLVRTLR